jgi:FtsZ-interacting cell division protein ZipA
MEAILIVVAALCLAAVVILAMTNTRSSKALSELSARLAESEQRLREFRMQLETKSKEADEIRSKHDRFRDEAKKAKKRAFELEQQDKEKATVPPAVTPQDDDILLETRAQAHQALAAAARANEDKNYALEQLEKLKGELAMAKQALKARHEDALKAERGESERHKKFETEVAALQEKLEQARKKTRTDAQVYRITKSKLDLALEKIASLERMLGAPSSNSPSRETVDASISTPPPEETEIETISTLKTDS